MTYSVQYDARGVVKEFKHPDRLKILRLKSSYADVVRPVFLNDCLLQRFCRCLLVLAKMVRMPWKRPRGVPCDK